MMILFDIVYAICFLCYLPFLFLKGKWHSGFRERFGFMHSDLVRVLSQGENIWLHAVSVGEVAAMEGVISALIARFPDKRVILTVATKTGHSFAQRKYQSTVMILWAPLDFSWTVGSFIRVIRPILYIAAETELWPNLFASLSAAKVPVLVLNGRISDQSFPRYQKIKWLLPSILKVVNVFGMQSEEDAERIIQLGADKKNVKVIGNVKFDNVPDAREVDPREYGCERDFMVLTGGSTHPGEEELLLDIFLSIKSSYPLLRLVLAPRHPERSMAVAELVGRAGLSPVLFSKNTAMLRSDQVMVVDTIGHLLEFYSFSSVVFVGKSLMVGGGHNIIEPAMFAKPIVIGPYMQNFKDITSAFLAQNAVMQVEDPLGLKAVIKRLLAEPGLRRELGERAKLVVSHNQGATQRAVDLVVEALRNK